MAEDLSVLLASGLERRGKAAWRRGDEAALRACIRVLKGRNTKAARGALDSLLALRSPSASPSRKAGEQGALSRETESPRAPRASSEPPRAWLARVTRVANEFESDGAGDCSVYLFLFKRDGEHGLYVGQTALSVAERYRQHKAGEKAGRGIVRDYGVRPLTDAARHLRKMSRDLAETVEGALWNRLKRAGFMVEGGH